MRSRNWLIGGVVALVVIGLGLWFGPRIYAKYFTDDMDPAPTVSAEGARPAELPLAGQWRVTAGADPNRTSAGYTVDEILNGEHVTVVGKTSEVSGSATIDGESLTAGTISVQVKSISTSDTRRDNKFRDDPTLLEVGRYPTATFTVTGPVDLSSVPDDGTIADVQLPGTLQVKDTTKTVTVDAKVLRTGDTIVVSGAVPVVWADYNVNPPHMPFVSVDANGTIDFLVSLQQ